jgi:siderophore synthetase component
VKPGRPGPRRCGSRTERDGEAARPSVTLGKVRRWACRHNIGGSKLIRAYNSAFLVAVSRLLEAIYREDNTTRSTLEQEPAGRWHLALGRGPSLWVPVSGPLPFRRLEVTGFPWAVAAGKRRRVRTPHAFLTALRRCLEASEISRYFERLTEDFKNSFANLVLNRLLGERLDGAAQAIEPAYEGHHYYPFPALRIGPSLAQVVACSHLCRDAIDLPLATVRPGRFDSAEFDDHRRCFAEWAGFVLPHDADVVIPLHPWQLKLSPIVGELLQRRGIVLLKERLKAVPLASQRTCRIIATGFDVKLAIDVTLTAEHRLLYPVNRANAPTVSTLARIFLESSGESTLDFQRDVASMAHGDRHIETHVAAIVRSPVSRRAGGVVVPAVNLWSGQRPARTLLDLRHPEQAYDFFRAYCRVLMRGPVEFYARWGMAFEPHLQNVYVGFQDGVPSHIVLRDLDGTILDPARTRPVVRANHLRLAPSTWQHMPPFEVGGQRLVHAMLYGHLGAVMSYLARHARADLSELSVRLEDVWTELIEGAVSPTCRRRVCELRAQSNTVKAMLRVRLARSAQLEFR